MFNLLFFNQHNKTRSVWVNGKAIETGDLKDAVLTEFIIKNKALFQIVDVRELEEYEAEHIENACLLPISSLSKNVSIPSTQCMIALVHCRSGARTRKNENAIIARLSTLGFNQVYFASEGIQNIKQCVEMHNQFLFRVVNAPCSAQHFRTH